VKTLNAIQFFLANGKGENGIYLIEDGMGSFRIGNIGGGNSGGAEWPIYFGNGGITGMSVRVLRGLVKFGGVNYTIPQTDVLVSGGNAESPTYGYLRFGLQTDVGLIESSTTATMPVEIGKSTHGPVSPFTGRGDEDILLLHKVPLVMFQFNDGSSKVAWPTDGLSADSKDDTYILTDGDPTSENVYDFVSASFKKVVTQTIRFSRRFKGATGWTPVSGTWISSLPTLHSMMGTEVDVVQLGIMAAGALYVNKDRIEITDPAVGAGIQTFELWGQSLVTDA